MDKYFAMLSQMQKRMRMSTAHDALQLAVKMLYQVA